MLVCCLCVSFIFKLRLPPHPIYHIKYRKRWKTALVSQVSGLIPKLIRIFYHRLQGSEAGVKHGQPMWEAWSRRLCDCRKGYSCGSPSCCTSESGTRTQGRKATFQSMYSVHGELRGSLLPDSPTNHKEACLSNIANHLHVRSKMEEQQEHRHCFFEAWFERQWMQNLKTA